MSYYFNKTDLSQIFLDGSNKSDNKQGYNSFPGEVSNSVGSFEVPLSVGFLYKGTDLSTYRYATYRNHDISANDQNIPSGCKKIRGFFIGGGGGGSSGGSIYYAYSGSSINVGGTGGNSGGAGQVAYLTDHKVNYTKYNIVIGEGGNAGNNPVSSKIYNPKSGNDSNKYLPNNFDNGSASPNYGSFIGYFPNVNNSDYIDTYKTFWSGDGNPGKTTIFTIGNDNLVTGYGNGGIGVRVSGWGNNNDPYTLAAINSGGNTSDNNSGKLGFVVINTSGKSGTQGNYQKNANELATGGKGGTAPNIDFKNDYITDNSSFSKYGKGGDGGNGGQLGADGDNNRGIVDPNSGKSGSPGFARIYFLYD